MNNDMEKKLDQLLAGLPKPQYDTDAWLTEDSTDAFDLIVSQRRRRVWLRWGAAAAVVAGLLLGAAVWQDKLTETPQSTVVRTVKRPPRPRPSFEEAGRQTATVAQQTPPVKAKPPRTTTPRPAVRPMTPIDSLADIVAHIESVMQDVRDSCYTANVKKLIRTDERLQRLVNRLILESIVTDTTIRTAQIDSQYNNDNEI